MIILVLMMRINTNMSAFQKVKKNVKMNFSLSLGPDPEERISIPDLSSMTKQEVHC